MQSITMQSTSTSPPFEVPGSPPPSDSGAPPPEAGPSTEPDVEVLDEEPRSILLALISQLTIGMDLHRVTLPTFILETRSMCERLTDFMSHPDLIIGIPKIQDPVDRFIAITRFFLSGWHIRPKGVKKPYNPVLGEFFRCTWELPDKSTSFYVCEQVSHHPPISAYTYINPHHNIYITGDLRPKSRFLGNSAATLMQGSFRVRFPSLSNEEYCITFPNVYVRGILFGRMFMELSDVATISCEETGLQANLEFKSKASSPGALLGGERNLNAVEGCIQRKSDGVDIALVSGKWSDALFVERLAQSQSLPQQQQTDSTGNSTDGLFRTKGSGTPVAKRTGFIQGVLNGLPRLPYALSSASEPNVENRESLFIVNEAMILSKNIAPESDMEEFESRRLWRHVTQGLQERNLDFATEQKSAIEDNQRTVCKNREDAKVEWVSRFFVPVGDEWKFDIEDLTICDPEIACEKLRKVIFARAKHPMHQQFWETD
ncbi:hypothetical protein HDU80_005261 [Chytriomyces hyalinus]|nr:hypothetical protein HDU80_005261 [Chytriomyces hyalinus]